jgi:signal transduction histidine kinase/GAF domain-containing protein
MSASGRPRPMAQDGSIDIAGDAPAGGSRFVAQLNMLHSLAATLASLVDVEEIGAAITEELRTILDYHNCRVYLLDADGHTLTPIAFRGEIFYEYEHETLEELIAEVGEGITGWVAEQRTSLLTPDARLVDFAVQIPGTDDLLESMLAVPMKVGDDLQGVIVLSSLGYGAFDEEDQRLLEVLASHAAVAFQNAKLLQGEREAGQTSSTLLNLSKQLTQLRSVGDILQRAIETVPSVIDVAAVGFLVRDDDSGDFRLARLLTLEPEAIRPRHEIADVPAEWASSLVFENAEPLVFTGDDPRIRGRDFVIAREPRDGVAAPVTWEPDGAGTLVVIGRKGEGFFGEREIRLVRGIADLTSLALGNARRFSELERFHELVAGLDAAFWEASLPDLGFTFLGGAVTDLLGADASAWTSGARAWGAHIDEHDREGAVREMRRLVEDGVGDALEYRVLAQDGSTRWIRDLVRVVKARGVGPTALRGLMVDVTERKRAERALLASERKYSDAFRREREAAQRLRTLDEMKNTFLEAVSHDLRTPLTSILGSALTLERSKLDLPRSDALDMVARIASNARKLERLLSDLLDLDRLQRGIVSPNRRSTDLVEFVTRAIAEADTHGRTVELDVEPGHVSIDQAKTERILENLLSNSVRHTPVDAKIWIRARPEEGGVLFVVEDDGPGVPEDLREEIFEPFRQAPGSSSEHAPGVGIGLSLVKRFAELHGGRAWAEERPGGGASFHVFLEGA